MLNPIILDKIRVCLVMDFREYLLFNNEAIVELLKNRIKVIGISKIENYTNKPLRTNSRDLVTVVVEADWSLLIKDFGPQYERILQNGGSVLHNSRKDFRKHNMENFWVYHGNVPSVKSSYWRKATLNKIVPWRVQTLLEKIHDLSQWN